jgi:hypothetical protein
MIGTGSWLKLSQECCGQAFVGVSPVGAIGHRSQLRAKGRPWPCSSGRMWSRRKDDYFEQVRQWEYDGSETKSQTTGRVNPAAAAHRGRPTQSTLGGNRYHASASGGPWGFNLARGRADDWKGGCFEWNGWQPSAACGRERKGNCQDRENTNDVDSVGDHYRVLGVPRFASEEEVRRGYRLMAKRWHPDTFADEPENLHSLADRRAAADANMHFIRIQEAMEVLGNPKKRWLYDRELGDWSDDEPTDRSNGRPAASTDGDNTGDTRNTPQLGKTNFEDFFIYDWQGRRN